MRPLSNERRIGRIEKKKGLDGWDVVEGDENGRAMVEVRYVRQSGGRWFSPRAAHPFRINARDARAIGAVLLATDTDGGRHHG